MPTRPLPNDPSREHLKKQAKRLRHAVRAGEPDALAQAREFHPRANEAIADFSLTDAQLVTARSYGFASWMQLKAHLDEIEPFSWNPSQARHAQSPVDVFLRLACLTYAGWHRSNPAKALRMLADQPDLATVNIYTAAAVGDVAAVRMAIDAEPTVLNAKGGTLQWPPLLYACYSRLEGTGANRSTLEVARLLLSGGADPNAGFLFAGTYAFTAITGAFGRGEDWHNQPPHPECDALARLLLEAGADPNDSQALYNRHFHANNEHLELLLAYGLGSDKGGPWLKRLRDENASPGKMLVQQLCWAAMHNFAERVKLLVEHGVDVNTPSPRGGRTPYEEALRAGHGEVAEYLLEHGARKIELDPLETFALTCIAGERDEARARLRADPTLLDRLGDEGRMEMLHRAVESKREAGIRLILELGVDINGFVPGTGLDRAVLHNAAGWGGLEMVELLLELGADPHLRDPTYHAKPIGWAFHNQQHEVVEHLLAFATIFDAVRCGGVERVATLLDADPALANARDEDGDPLVFYLHPEIPRLDEMIQLLAARGARFDAPNPDGTTAVDRALAQGWIDFARQLRAAVRGSGSDLDFAANDLFEGQRGQSTNVDNRGKIKI